MATNQVKISRYTLNLDVGAALASGAAAVVGQIPGVLQTNANASNVAEVQTAGVFNLDVGISTSATLSATVTLGATVYFTDGDDPPIALKSDGVRFGYALGTVSLAASHATIPVLLGR